MILVGGSLPIFKFIPKRVTATLPLRAQHVPRLCCQTHGSSLSPSTSAVKIPHSYNSAINLREFKMFPSLCCWACGSCWSPPHSRFLLLRYNAPSFHLPSHHQFWWAHSGSRPLLPSPWNLCWGSSISSPPLVQPASPAAAVGHALTTASPAAPTTWQQKPGVILESIGERSETAITHSG